MKLLLLSTSHQQYDVLFLWCSMMFSYVFTFYILPVVIAVGLRILSLCYWFFILSYCVFSVLKLLRRIIIKWWWGGGGITDWKVLSYAVYTHFLLLVNKLLARVILQACTYGIHLYRQYSALFYTVAEYRKFERYTCSFAVCRAYSIMFTCCI